MSGRILGFAATFFIPVVLVRIFNQAEFGTYKQLFLIYSTLYGIVQLGMAESLYYFLPRAPRRGGTFATNSLLFLGCAGALCLALLEIESASVAGWLGNPTLADHLSPLGIYLFLTMVSSILEIVMVSRQRFITASLTYAMSDLARVAFFILPALLHRQLEWLLWGAVAYALLRLCFTFFYVWHEFEGNLMPRVPSLMEQLAYALPFAAGGLLADLAISVHMYVVSNQFDAATFAIYAVGCLQIPLVDFLASSAGNVLMVRMSEKIKGGQPEAVVALWHDGTRKLALVFFPMVALLLVVANEIIVLLFTEAYRASVPIFMIGSTAILFAVWQTDAVLRVYADIRFLFVLNVVRLSVVAALIMWFLSVFQLEGAVLVTVLATLVAKGLALARIKRLMRISISQLMPWGSLAGIFATASGVALLALGVKSELNMSPLVLSAVVGLFYMGSYLLLLCQFRILSEDERLALTGWLKRRLPGAARVADLRS